MTTLHPVDIAILVLYLIAIVASGVWLSRRAAEDLSSYFLGGRTIHWFFLGVSNASSMFDAAGTMTTVAWLYLYGVKSLWIPWVWPTFNQIFMMIFLAAWLRRSNVLTGAEWLRTRFGDGIGLKLAHISVVLFAIVAVVNFIGYAFVGVGKFSSLLLPWDYTDNQYAMVLVSITSVYVLLGGMYSVVLTDVVQFLLLTIAALVVGWIAMSQTSAEQIAAATPAGWDSLWFGWKLDIDWSDKIAVLNEVIAKDGANYQYFMPFVMMVFCKGILSSIAGPTPGYDMQRVLAARNAREASLMSGIVSPVLVLPRYLMIAGIAVLALVYFSDQINSQATAVDDKGELVAQIDVEKLLPMVITQFLPIGVTGLLLAGLFAAFMSTFDSSLNAGAAYLTNDVYRRYFRPHASPKELIVVSYITSLAVVAMGIVCGLSSETITSSIEWIAGALFGGYAIPNMLKWIWWRLNGAGYFAGMLVGVFVALFLPSSWLLFSSIPVLLASSGVVAIVVSLLTKPDDPEVLANFYRQVRPWGFWGPVKRRVLAEDPSFVPNPNFARDMTNCAVGIVWQLSLCALPVFLVLKNWPATAASAAVALVTTLLLKANWYRHLETD